MTSSASKCSEKVCFLVNRDRFACVRACHAGAPLFGVLPMTSIGEVVEPDAKLESEAGLADNITSHNAELLAETLKRAETWREQLHKATVDDAKLGRMSHPVPQLDVMHLSGRRAVPRFGVEQGLNSAGEHALLTCAHDCI